MINAIIPMVPIRASLVAALVWVMGFQCLDNAVAQEESESKKKEVITFGNSDVGSAPPIIVLRDKPKPRVNLEVGLEDAEGEEGEEGEDATKLDEDGNPIVKNELEVEKEAKIVDSFVVLKGSRRFHLSSCLLVGKTKREKSSLNGAAVIKGKYYSCSICKPPAPIKNPPKVDASPSSPSNVGTPNRSPLAPKGRAPKPEPKADENEKAESSAEPDEL